MGDEKGDVNKRTTRIWNPAFDDFLSRAMPNDLRSSISTDIRSSISTNTNLSQPTQPSTTKSSENTALSIYNLRNTQKRNHLDRQFSSAIVLLDAGGRCSERPEEVGSIPQLSIGFAQSNAKH